MDEIRVILSTPDRTSTERLWTITFKGVLRLEYEAVGRGQNLATAAPVEIYSVYLDEHSEERRRWIQRLEQLGKNPSEAGAVSHVVLASSFVRGWARARASRAFR